MKIMIVNYNIAKIQDNVGINQKSGSWFHSLLCNWIYEKVLTHVIAAEGTTQITLCIT